MSDVVEQISKEALQGWARHQLQLRVDDDLELELLIFEQRTRESRERAAHAAMVAASQRRGAATRGTPEWDRLNDRTREAVAAWDAAGRKCAEIEQAVRERLERRQEEDS